MSPDREFSVLFSVAPAVEGEVPTTSETKKKKRKKHSHGHNIAKERQLKQRRAVTVRSEQHALMDESNPTISNKPDSAHDHNGARALNNSNKENIEENFLDEEISDLEAGKPKRTRMPRTKKGRRYEPMEVSVENANVHSSSEDDFWICCLAQGFCGVLGSAMVYCANSHRENYPTDSACNGCLMGFAIAFCLSFVFFLLGGNLNGSN